MPLYAWRNIETNEIVEVERSMADSQLAPEPDDQGKWQRVYNFGVGRVEGGGGSPGRSSVVKHD